MRLHPKANWKYLFTLHWCPAIYNSTTVLFLGSFWPQLIKSDVVKIITIHSYSQSKPQNYKKKPQTVTM